MPFEIVLELNVHLELKAAKPPIESSWYLHALPGWADWSEYCFSSSFCLLGCLGGLVSPKLTLVFTKSFSFFFVSFLFVRIPPLLWLLVSYVCQGLFTKVLPLLWVDSNWDEWLAMQAIVTYWYQQRCVLDRYIYCKMLLPWCKKNGTNLAAI